MPHALKAHLSISGTESRYCAISRIVYLENLVANYATYGTHLMLSSYFCPRHPTVETLLPVGFYTPKITRLVILDWTAREYLRSKAMIDLLVAFVAKQRMCF